MRSPACRSAEDSGYAELVVDASSTETHCENCGAAVFQGAEWCGLCFEPIRKPRSAGDVEGVIETSAPPETVDADTPAAGVTDAVAESEAKKAPMWPCPACGDSNPIELDNCATCGTPFAALMRRDEAAPKVEPSVAFRRSLLYPGLGHQAVGRGADGLARGVLFTVFLSIAFLTLLSGARSPAVDMMLLLFGGGALLVYMMSAIEARQLADGGGLIVASRTLMWFTVGVLLSSIVIVAFVIGTAGKR